MLGDPVVTVMKKT